MPTQEQDKIATILHTLVDEKKISHDLLTNLQSQYAAFDIISIDLLTTKLPNSDISLAWQLLVLGQIEDLPEDRAFWEQRDERGRTTFHFLAWAGHFDLIKKLSPSYPELLHAVDRDNHSVIDFSVYSLNSQINFFEWVQTHYPEKCNMPLILLLLRPLCR